MPKGPPSGEAIRLAGLCIGLVCGAGELFLLTRITRALRNGASLQMIGIVFAKIALLACALVPTALWFKHDLIWCGVGITSVLILGAVVINLIRQKKEKGEK